MNASVQNYRDRAQDFQEFVRVCLKRLLRLTHHGANCNPFTGFEDFDGLGELLEACPGLAPELKNQIEPSQNVIPAAFESLIAKIPTGDSMGNVWERWTADLALQSTTDLQQNFGSEFLHVGEFLTSSDLGLIGSRLSIQAMSNGELQEALRSDFIDNEKICGRLGLSFDDFKADCRIQMGVDPEPSPSLPRYAKIEVKKPSHANIVACIVGCHAAEIRRRIKRKFDFGIWNQIRTNLSNLVDPTSEHVEPEKTTPERLTDAEKPAHKDDKKVAQTWDNWKPEGRKTYKAFAAYCHDEGLIPDSISRGLNDEELTNNRIIGEQLCLAYDRHRKRKARA